MKQDTFRVMILTTLLASLSPGLVFSEVVHRQLGEDDIAVSVKNESWQPEEFQNGTNIPATYVGITDITLDGMDNEQDWAKAIEVTIPLNHGNVKEAFLKALYTSDDVGRMKQRIASITPGYGMPVRVSTIPGHKLRTQ